MNQHDIKEYIYNNNMIELVLENLGCHHIKYHAAKGYYSCARPDGKNITAINIKNNEYLDLKWWSRDIVNRFGNPLSLIDLVCNIKDCYWTSGLKWICDVVGLDYYEDYEEELPEALRLTKELMKMNSEEDIDVEEEILKPVNEKILTYYEPLLSKLFRKDGISYAVQKEFEIGYDLESHRITIPIRDELGTLVGVKGRYRSKEVPEGEQKYLYLIGCAKTKILYGLYKSYKAIKETGIVIVVESEKSVLLAYTYGIYNVISIGGHVLSKYQAEKLTALGCKEIILCYDEDVGRNEDGSINMKCYDIERSNFLKQQKVSAMIDFDGNILNKKESPIDNKEKFDRMYKDRVELKVKE